MKGVVLLNIFELFSPPVEKKPGYALLLNKDELFSVFGAESFPNINELLLEAKKRVTDPPPNKDGL